MSENNETSTEVHASASDEPSTSSLICIDARDERVFDILGDMVIVEPENASSDQPDSNESISAVTTQVDEIHLTVDGEKSAAVEQQPGECVAVKTFPFVSCASSQKEQNRAMVKAMLQ